MMNNEGGKSSGWVLFGLAILGFGVAAVILPITDYILSFVRWISSQGPAGPYVFAGLYFIAGLVMLPMLPIGILAGMAYGLGEGFWVLLPAALGSAVLATILGNSVLKVPVLRYVERRPAWRAVCEALSEKGVRAVILNRLAPVLPFGLQNYALGAVGVRPMAQFWGTLIGMQPALWVALYIGSAVTDFAQAKAEFGQTVFSGPRLYLMVAAGIAMGVLVLWLGSVARRALRENTSKENDDTVE